VEYEEELTAWKHDIDSWKVQLESCLKDLEVAIRSENFEQAKVLRVTRDALKARPLPAMPIQPNGASTETSEIPAGIQSSQPVPDNVSQASTQESILLGEHDNRGNGGRAESSGIGFLFSVWTHNPAHTPKHDDMHH